MPQHIYTRCPECHTVFRVTDKHLQLAKGRVRCGACLHIFKATDHMVRPKDQSTSIASSSTLAASAKSTASSSSALPSSVPKTETPASPTEADSEKESTISRSLEKLLPEETDNDIQDSHELLKASTEAEIDIHFDNGNREKVEYPIDTFGQNENDSLETAEETNSEFAPFDEENSSLSIQDDQPEEESLNSDWQTELDSQHDDDYLSTENIPLEDEPLSNAKETSIEREPLSLDDDQKDDLTTYPENLPVSDDTDDFNDAYSGQSLENQSESKPTESDDHDDKSISEGLEQREAEWTNTDFDAFDDAPTNEILETEPEAKITDHSPSTQKGEAEDTELNVDTSSPALHSDFSVNEQDTLDHLTSESTEDWATPPVDGEELVMDRLNQKLKSEDLDPDPLDEFEDIVSTHSHKIKYVLAGLLVLVGLGWGSWTLWNDRQTLAWDDTWGGLVMTMCEALPCDLKPRRDLAAIELLQRSVKPNDDDPEVSEFSLIIRNNAHFEQPYPTIEIRFTDTNGNQVSQQQFAPDQYLSKELVDTKMPVAQRVHVLITARNAQSNAFGFEFTFL